MLRWLRLAAVCGVVLVWSNEAFAVVQNTDVAVTKPAGETGSATLTLTQKDTSNRTVKTDTIRVARTQPRARQTVRIDPDKAKTVDVTIETDKGKRTVSVDVTRLLSGGPIDLGEGFSIQGSPSAATPRGVVVPARRTYVADTASNRRDVPGGNPGPSTFMPNFFVSVVGGGLNLGGDGGGTPNVVSRDTLPGGGTNIRGVSAPGSQGTVGVFGTVEFPIPAAANGMLMPTTFSVTSGALFPTDGEVTTPFSFAGTVPLGAGTVTIKDGPTVPLIFELGFPVARNTTFLIGGGGFFTTRETTITVQEAGAPGTAPFTNRIEQTFFDPAFTAGVRVGVADLNQDGRIDTFFSLKGMVRWKEDGDSARVRSPTFGSQDYTVNANRGGTDGLILASLDVNLNSFFAFDRGFQGGVFVASDIRLKRDIARVGTLDSGLPLYRYRYLWSDQVHVGVMAQEVADVAPDAVVKGDDGYLRVNYARLGTSMKTWEQWSAERGWLSRDAN
ncbi:MAG: tail fiber domain-containing protein [Xanthobacteraceae bacterium]|nr:tail fiber domain-containing protein [Xanthobacteraceae bacterium]